MTADYADEGRESSSFARWLPSALLLSLLLHAGLFVWLSRVPLIRSDKEYYEKIVPRAFTIQPAKIDAKLLEPDPAENKQTAMAPEPVKLPEDHVSFQKLMSDATGTPAMPKIDQNVLSEKPTAASTTLAQTVATAQTTGAQSVLEDSRSLQQELLNDKPDAGTVKATDLLQPDAVTGRAIVQAGTAAGNKTVPGFSNLDELLAQTGPLTSETAPILMPTDLLFDYDHADLRPQAMASLQKLGTLISRNPQAIFRIEGHTDSFGSDAYNQDLSQRRAEMVKTWLISTMGIPAERITAKGYGKTHLLVPTGTIDQQQINRRVEIVINPK